MELRHKNSIVMMGVLAVLVATSAAAGSATVDDEPRLGFQLRLGYEASWLRLSRLGFDGQVSGYTHVPERYELDIPRGDLVTHGVIVRPNIIYQPGDVPLQLTVGFHFGFGLGRTRDYLGTTATGMSVTPDPDRLAVALRAAVPVGLRLDLGGAALRSTIVPGIGLIAVDERLQGAGSAVEGTATGVSELVRGELGVEVPVTDSFGFTLDGGYDFGLAGGWFLGTGMVLTFSPQTSGKGRGRR